MGVRDRAVTSLSVAGRGGRQSLGNSRVPEHIAEWSKELGDHGEVIVYCVHGHNVSQGARDFLRERGLRARIVEGGIEAWQAFSKNS